MIREVTADKSKCSLDVNHYTKAEEGLKRGLKIGCPEVALLESSAAVRAEHVLFLLDVVLLFGAPKRMSGFWLHCCYVVNTV